MNNVSAYRTISAQKSANFFNADKLPGNGNCLISLNRIIKERTMRYKVMRELTLC